ncbi:MAG: GIY-YIG nuclease family protein [Mesorhizobium sp.]|nr:MAG: GIY-YIG nuclease family protein [Mesorhizobium sp.]
MSGPRNIHIYLPSGDPQAIRVADIPTRIMRLVEVPRSLLDDFLTMPEALQVGIYFLTGEDDASGALRLYVGQSGNVGKRLSQHNETKDFWNRALVAISLTNNLTTTHVAYLEWWSLQKASQAGRYALENGNAAAKPHILPPLQADCDEIFETIRVLLTTLGFPLFEGVATAAAQSDPADLYSFKTPYMDAKGLYTEEGFVVLTGSYGPATLVKSAIGTTIDRQRGRAIASGAAHIEGDRIVFSVDYLFTSPSAAASCLASHSANGWTSWKRSDGRTLHEVHRLPNQTSPGEGA